MSRLIDANALKDKAFGRRKGLVHSSDIDAAPTIPAIPVEWLTDMIDRTAYADRNGDYAAWALHGAAYAVWKKWKKEQKVRGT